MTEQFAVVGTPVSHSLSPAIHNAIFAHEGRDAQMVAIDPQTEEECFEILERWRTEGAFTGLAVTAPYKPLAAQSGATRSSIVDDLGLANTLTLQENADGKTFWHSDNTDVDGFVTAIQYLLSPLTYRTFIVFGTGAVARTIVYALQREGAALVQVVGRSREKAQACIDIPAQDADGNAVSSHQSELIASTAPPGKRFDCAINATTLGLSSHDEPVFPWAWFEEYAATVFDVVYRRHGTTRLVGAARQHDMPALDGRTMLASQAVEQALIWGAQTPRAALMRIAQHASEDAAG